MIATLSKNCNYLFSFFCHSDSRPRRHKHGATPVQQRKPRTTQNNDLARANVPQGEPKGRGLSRASPKLFFFSLCRNKPTSYSGIILFRQKPPAEAGRSLAQKELKDHRERPIGRNDRYRKNSRKSEHHKIVLSWTHSPNLITLKP